MCLVTMSVHIEVTESLSTDAFLNAKRRMVGRRGPIRILRCDRGTNLAGAQTELQRAIDEMDFDKIQRELLSENCDLMEFNYNFPKSQHMGGVWERMVGIVKRVLSGLLLQHSRQLDRDSFYTFVIEAETIVNSRPLTPVDSTDPDSPPPLTPSQLLTATSAVVMPSPGDFVHQDMYCRKRWRRVQYLANQFWLRWHKEFVHQLQSRRKWQADVPDVTVGDHVMLVGESLDRSLWVQGVITEVLPRLI